MEQSHSEVSETVDTIDIKILQLMVGLKIHNVSRFRTCNLFFNLTLVLTIYGRCMFNQKSMRAT